MLEDKWVWVNGGLLPAYEVHVSPYSHGLHYATSCFEGIRAYPQLDASGRETGEHGIWMLTDHMERLLRSCNAYRIPCPYSVEQLVAAACRVVRVNGGESYVRPIVFRTVNPETGMGLGVDPGSASVTVMIMTAPWGRYVAKHLHNGGASVHLTSLVRPPTGTFP